MNKVSHILTVVLQALYSSPLLLANTNTLVIRCIWIIRHEFYTVPSFADIFQNRLRNDLYCVEWDVKLYYTIPYHISEGRLSQCYKFY